MSMGYSTEKEKSDKPGFEESEPNKTLCFNLNPKAGYFVHNNLLVGLDIGVAYSKKLFETGEYAFNEKTTLCCAGPFIRYYFNTKISKPFLEITIHMGANQALFHLVEAQACQLQLVKKLALIL